MWLFASIFLLLISQTCGKFCKYPHKHREQHLINAYGVPVEGCFYLVVHSSVCIYDAFGQGYGFRHTVWSDKMWAEVVLRNSSWYLSNNSFQHLCKFFSYRSEILKMDGPLNGKKVAGHPSRWHLWRWGRDPTAPPPTPSCPGTGVKNWNHFIGDWDVGAPLFQRPVAVVLFCSSEVFADVYLAHVTLSSTLDCGGSCNVIARTFSQQLWNCRVVTLILSLTAQIKCVWKQL